jgi:DTW domain-containing protein YfiP
MDKAAYLSARRQREETSAPFKREQTCYRCYWLKEYCLCPLIKPFMTQARFVILMHTMEARKEKLGTGRISRAGLLNSEIIVGVDFSRDARVNALIADPGNHCVALYPGDKSLDISRGDVAPLLETKASGKRLVVFLLDGTWQCAKKMMRLSANINRLPRVSFSSERRSIFYIKEQPADFCLSTLESIHVFLDEADRRGLESLPARPQDNLIEVFRHMIDFMVKCAKDPNKRLSYRGNRTGYSDPKTRKKRRGLSQRNIVYKD